VPAIPADNRRVRARHWRDDGKRDTVSADTELREEAAISAASPYYGRSLRILELDDRTQAMWAALEDHALEPNAFLSPRFVLPALRHLGPAHAAARARLVFILWRNSGDLEMVGAGLFVPALPGRRLPLPHSSAYRSPHSYLTGVLLHREHAEPAARVLFAFLRLQPWVGHGVEFDDCPVGGAQARLVMAAAAQCHVRWWESSRNRRAVFDPAAGGEPYLAAYLSRSRTKSVRRCRRQLEQLGRLSWRLIRGPEVDDRCIETFLRLEHSGWKASQGSSVLSSPQQEAFFR
jgi:hypothetical protein